MWTTRGRRKHARPQLLDQLRVDRGAAAAGNEGGPGKPSPPVECGAVELRDHDPVAVSDDLAARDLGLVGDQRFELLLADPGDDDVRRLLALLRRLEETERAEDAVAGLDQPVAHEPRQLLQPRDEGLVDLAGQLGRAILVHTVVTANDRMHTMLLLSIFQGRKYKLPAALGPG